MVYLRKRNPIFLARAGRNCSQKSQRLVICVFVFFLTARHGKLMFREGHISIGF